jgi:hypothetical protein
VLRRNLPVPRKLAAVVEREAVHRRVPGALLIASTMRRLSRLSALAM